MVTIATLLLASPAMLAVVGIGSSFHNTNNESTYALLLGVAVLAMAALGFASFVILFPQ